MGHHRGGVDADPRVRVDARRSTATDGATADAARARRITPGIATPLPVVLSSAAPYSDEFCGSAGAGRAVHRQDRGLRPRGNDVARVLQGLQRPAGRRRRDDPLQPDAAGHRDRQPLPAGRASGRRHRRSSPSWRPTPASRRRSPRARRSQGQGDVMAAFSSRGPGTQFLKPDVTAPGVQILAGDSPTPDAPRARARPGTTSRPSPARRCRRPTWPARRCCSKALHPDWTPAAIKSALETTATTSVVKEDLTTPADPFDMGGGRIDLTKAGADGAVVRGVGPALRRHGGVADRGGEPEPAVGRRADDAGHGDGEAHGDQRERPRRCSTSRRPPPRRAPRSGSRPGSSWCGRGRPPTSTSRSRPPSATDAAAVLRPGRAGAAVQHGARSSTCRWRSWPSRAACRSRSRAIPRRSPAGESSTCAVTVDQQHVQRRRRRTGHTSVDRHLRITGADGATVDGGQRRPGTVTLGKKVDGDPQPVAGDSPAAGEYLPLAGFGVRADGGRRRDDRQLQRAGVRVPRHRRTPASA